MTERSISPGAVWNDTDGNPIQAHGGSVIEVDGIFYWYGENKERTRPGNGIWHWGIRCYSSTDLTNWTDRGVIIPPNEDDPDSPLHPSQMVDRPHIIWNTRTGRFVCWLKIMGADEAQRSTVLVADRITGPYAIVRTGLRPLDMSAGDFDLVVDPDDAQAYYFFERVHSDLICADLDDDYTDVTGSYTTHFPRGCPPFVREAPAHFVRGGVHYLVTSGTTGYHPNPSEIASASSYHGPWTVLGDPHPTDSSRTSFNSQISSVFRHPAKRDLYIAVADRWMPDLPEQAGGYFATGEASAVATRIMARVFDAEGAHHDPGNLPGASAEATQRCGRLLDLSAVDTSVSRYVWLPFSFDGDVPTLEWRDEWSIDEFD